jgi:hypothetical protein
MPFTGLSAALGVVLPAEMLWNVSPLAPMVVLATFSAVALVELMLLPEPVTFTIPPPVATKPLPVVVSMSRPPRNSLLPGALVHVWRDVGIKLAEAA